MPEKHDIAAAAPVTEPARAEEAARQQRLAEIDGAEQAALRTRALVEELIDERFNTLTDRIQTKLGGVTSRRKR